MDNKKLIYVNPEIEIIDLSDMDNLFIASGCSIDGGDNDT